MEFHKKLQDLRKQKGLTQEELAEALYVSRTAISKWESGRGYPNIDSLKAIAQFFGVTIDELLSGRELLTIAETDGKEKEQHFSDLEFGLLDCSTGLFFFLPLFGQKTTEIIAGVSLPVMTGISPYLKIAYFAIIIIMIAVGLLTLTLQNCRKAFWTATKSKLSLLFNAVGALLFVISLQPYAATYLLVILVIKVLMLIKWQ